MELTLQSQSREGTELGEAVLLLPPSLLPLQLAGSPGGRRGLLPPSCLVLDKHSGLGFPVPALSELVGPPAV